MRPVAIGEFVYLHSAGANILDPVSSESLADLHMEACISAIRGFCLLEGITHESFAAAIGITPVHLSYVLGRRREPGEKFSRGVERSGRLPQDLKEHLLLNIWAARRYREQERDDLLYRADHEPLAEFVLGLEQEYAAVGNGQIEEARARRLYRRLYRCCQTRTADPGQAMRDPLAFARLCVMQSDIGGILNRVYDSLHAALLAERLIYGLEAREPRSRIVEFHSPDTNVLRVKGVALYNLRLYRRACDEFARAGETQAAKETPALWLPHLVRDGLKALARAGRFAIRDAEAYARQGWLACTAPAWEAPIGEMLSVLIDISLVRYYTAHGGPASLRKARRLLRGHLDSVRRGGLHALTPLHRVLLYKAQAEIEASAGGSHGAGQNEALAEALRAALRVAAQAGLANQLHKMRARYTALAERLAAEEGVL